MATSPVSSGWRSESSTCAGEFRHLVEEQHAVMRERNLARPRAQAAADQRRHRGGMMRRAERPPVGERAAFDLAGDRSDHRHFEQFGRRAAAAGSRAAAPPASTCRRRAGRSSSRLWPPAAATSSARLALSWPLMSARSSGAAVELADLRLRPRQHLRALEMIGELDERAARRRSRSPAGPGRFRPAGRRADQALRRAHWRRSRPAARRRRGRSSRRARVRPAR